MKAKLSISIYCLLMAFLISCSENYDGFNMGDIESLPDTYNEKYKDYEENPFVKVTDQPISTFSVDARRAFSIIFKDVSRCTLVVSSC